MSLERWLYKLHLRFRSLIHRDQVETELNEEFQYHLDCMIESLIAEGVPAAEARYEALRSMDGLVQQQERCRDARGLSLWDDLVQDIRYALRTFKKNASLTASVVLSLALGIGANTAIFSVINVVMLQLLPVKNPQELVLLTWSSMKWPEKYVSDLEGNSSSDPKTGISSFSLSSKLYEEIKAQNHVFESIFAFAANDPDVNVGINGHSSSAHLQAVSGNFFSGLGVTPAFGRPLLPSDDEASAPPVIVVSYEFWRKNFGNENFGEGKNVVVDGISVRIAGVAPPQFFGVTPGTATDIWVPLTFYTQEWIRQSGGDALTGEKVWWLGVVGRLKPGVSEVQARSELTVLFNRVLNLPADEIGGPETPFIGIIPASRGLNSLRNRFSASLVLLMGMVGLLLLIACANVAGLLIARAAARQKEIAVRLSLGAPRNRIVRQLLTESVLLGALGGLCGLLISIWASNGLVALLGSGRDPISVAVHVDARVLGFTAFVSLITGILFGLAPAYFATRISVSPTLKEISVPLTSKPGSRFRIGRALVVCQIALCLLLLIGAGLLMRTLDRLQRENLGFDRNDLVTFQVRPGLNGYHAERLSAYYQELQQRVLALPGVSSVTFSQYGPINGGMSNNQAQIPGYTSKGKDAQLYRHIVGSDYFQTLKIPVIGGRTLTEQDTASAPKAMIVNEALVRKYFHGDNPIGHRIVYDSKKSSTQFEIVGVVKDVKYSKIRNDVPPTVYMPYQQAPFLSAEMTFLVRTQGDPSPVMSAIRQTCLQLDKDVPLVNMQTETDVISRALYMERTFALLSSAFGLLALLLACVGLYGTVAYTVSRRTNEIGIRMALGATRETILQMVITETGRLILLGVLIGIPIAAASTKLLRSQLFQLSPYDPVTVIGATVAILLVSLIAGYLPAHRASRVDPIVALRCE